MDNAERAERWRAETALLSIRSPISAAEWNACISLVRDVCIQLGWEEVEELISEWIAPRRCALVYATDSQCETVGILVMAGHDGFPMKSLRQGWPKLTMQGSRPAEIVFLAAVSGQSGSDAVNLALIREIRRYSRREGVTDLYAILDKRRTGLYRKYGINFEAVPPEHGGGAHMFWGEPCFPVHLPRATAEAHLQAHHHDIWSIVGADSHEG